MKAKSNTPLNKIPLFDSKGKNIESIDLNKEVFDGKSNNSLLYQAVLMYRANMRRGTASTKTRGDVRGAGKKPWRQKGTGRARVGSIRNPVWRGGGIAFGPHPRDYSYSLPKKIKKKAFISSLNAKLKTGEVAAVQDFSIDEPKTKKIWALLKVLKMDRKKVLLLVPKIDNNLKLSTRNIKKLTLKKIEEATAMDVLSSDNVVMTKEAVGFLDKRVSK